MKVNMGQPNDLLLDDLELLLREIEEFNTASSNNKPTDIPHTLDNYLQFVAKSGNTVFPWPHVRSLFRAKIISAIQQFQEPTCTNESFVLERFDMFRIAAPFTVQRLTELILQPTRHYRKKEKFLRGLEKTVLVVSTIEPRSLTGEEEKNGNENDVHNVSASSGEGDAETVAFNLFHCVAPEREDPNLATPLQPTNATADGQILEQRDISLDTGDSEVEMMGVTTSLVNMDKSVNPEPSELLETTITSAVTLESPATNLEETPPIPLIQPIDDPANSNVEQCAVEDSPVDPSIELAVSSVSNLALAAPLQPTNAIANDQLLEQRDISLDTGDSEVEVELKEVSTSLVNIDKTVNPESSELLESSINSAAALVNQATNLEETPPVPLPPIEDPADSNVVQQCPVEESPEDPSIELASVSSVSHLATPLQSTNAADDGQLLEQRDISISLDTGDSEVELKDVSTSLVNMDKSQNAEPSKLLESSMNSPAAVLESQPTNLKETPPAPLQPIVDPASSVSVELVEESPADPSIELSSVSLPDSIEVEAKTNLFHVVD